MSIKKQNTLNSKILAEIIFSKHSFYFYKNINEKMYV